MITIRVQHDAFTQSKAHALAVFVEQDAPVSQAVKDFAQKSFPHLEEYLKEIRFTGATGSVTTIPLSQTNGIVTLMIVGLGKKTTTAIPVEQFRRAVGSLIKVMQSKHIDMVSILVPSSDLFKVTPHYLGQQIATIAYMASYRFDEFITDQKRKVNQDLELELHGSKEEEKELQQGVNAGSIIGTAVNYVRHCVDLPPSTLTPTSLAEKAQTIAQDYGLAIKIFSEQQVKDMGMGGLAGVSAGSDQDCKLVIMEYKTDAKKAPTVAFVGKGITFDSGGLSIKPATAMETMKEDMAGAASVMGAMQALAQLKPKINIIAVMPIAENLPSGKATKPGDIVRFYNGKTAEILNTDAEGRLILADALSYAVKHYKLDAIVDLATLTGACAYALGPFFSGLMSQHDDLVARLDEAATLSGDRIWRLPFDNDYKVAVVSQNADICNIGKSKYKAGAITAGFFLQHFVDDVPWAHLDIAGTAFDVPDISYYTSGATGVGVRLLIELAMAWK